MSLGITLTPFYPKFLIGLGFALSRILHALGVSVRVSHPPLADRWQCQDHAFKFDHVLADDTDQVEVFHQLGKPQVEKVPLGYVAAGWGKSQVPKLAFTRPGH